jgi:TonB family protein
MALAKKPLFALLTFCTLGTVTLAFACGGGGKAGDGPKGPGTTPGEPAATGSPNGDPVGTGNTGNAGSSGGTTTTTALPNGGELQGAKLGSSTRTEVATKGEGGPKSTGGKPSGEPGRTPEDIKTIVLLRREEARACYDRALTAHPGIEGDLTVKWTIDPQGNVTDAAVDTSKSQILEPSVGTCVVEVIKKIKFNPSAKGYETRANYPFNFHPKNFPAGAKDAGR